MKKKILFSLSMLLLGNISLMAQNWTVGGNALAGPGLLGSTNNFRVSFITNNAERGRITGTGLFGFGTTAPTARVHVNSGAGTNPFQVDVAGTAALLVNGADSRVGIGTTAPSTRLHINSAAAEDPFRVQVSSATKFFIDDNGNIGIGDAAFTPETNLHILRASAGSVTGNSNAPLVIENNTSNFINLLTPDANEKGILFGDVSNAADGGIVYNSSNSMQFRTNGNVTRMTLNSLGDLTVNGDLSVVGTTVDFGSVEELSDIGSNTIGCNSDFVTTSDGLNSLGTSSNTWLDVWATDNTINTSDIREKTNIKDLNYGLKEIMELRAVRFNWKKIPEMGDKIGVIAQEVQKVLPEVVRDWEFKKDETTGQKVKVPAAKLGIMYDEFIPVLIRGMQEQQQIIQDQRKEINDFKDRLAKLEAAVNAVSSNDLRSNDLSSKAITASLQQNQPNPFNQTTTIRYTIPQGANAQIMVYDASGRLMKTMQATQSGHAQINASELRPGTYQYALMVNGTVVANKTMIMLK